MENLKSLNFFFDAIRNNGRVGTTHIGVYAALLQLKADQGGQEPITFFSGDVMKVAKIASPTTFHRCIRDLADYGLIRYERSYNRFKGSKIYLELE